jgi:Lar family restriction alleviation protein
MGSELKPCPFCGSSHIRFEGWFVAHGMEYNLACSDCKAKGPSVLEGAGDAEWNRRAE